MTKMNTRPHSRRRVACAFLAAAALVLAGCSTGPSENASTEPPVTSLESYGLDGLDAAQIIEELDTMPVADRPDDLIASVQPTELVLTTDGQGLATIPMPEDQFYLSVAPYDTSTHRCHFHSLTTCLGELANENVQITVTDDSTGEAIVEGTRTTYDNGFIGLWLPRGITATLAVEKDGKTASTRITTDDDDLTCLTSLQLT